MEKTCFICMDDELIGKIIKMPCNNRCNEMDVHEKCIYEWQERSYRTCPLCRQKMLEIDYKLFDKIGISLMNLYSFRKQFINSPLSKEIGMIRCYVRVNSPYDMDGRSLCNNKYEMYIQKPTILKYPFGSLPNNRPIDGDKLILVANNNSMNNVDISLDVRRFGITDYNKMGVNYCGSVKSSILGLTHKVIIPVRSFISDNIIHYEIAIINYTYNRIVNVGPRKMNITIPNISKKEYNEYNEHISDWEICEERNLLSAQNKIVGKNKEPYWSNTINAHSLDFNGRVTLPSNKNFQIMFNQSELSTNDNSFSFMDFGGIDIQFGKVNDNFDGNGAEIYTLDFKWPISPLQAFGICISSCISKIACA